MSSVVLKITEGTREQINNLARITGKPQETVLREVVETGLKSYTATPTKSVNKGSPIVKTTMGSK